MQKREKVLVVTASGTLLLFVANQFLCSAPTKSSAASREAVRRSISTSAKMDRASSGPEHTQAGGVRSPRLLRIGHEPRVRFTVWHRDPFRGANQFFTAPGAARDDSSDVQLHGIAWKDGEGWAMLGDAILRKGESAGNLQVLDIRKDRVLCRLNGNIVTFVLSTSGDSMTTP